MLSPGSLTGLEWQGRVGCVQVKEHGCRFPVKVDLFSCGYQQLYHSHTWYMGGTFKECQCWHGDFKNVETYHYTQVIVCFNDRVVPLIRLLTHTVYLSGSFFPTFRYVRLFSCTSSFPVLLAKIFKVHTFKTAALFIVLLCFFVCSCCTALSVY